MSAIQQVLSSYKPTVFTYATWNPSDKNSYITLSNWNHTATAAVTWGQYWLFRATIGKSSWKWYREITHNDVTTWARQDWVANISAVTTWTNELWKDANTWCFREYDFGVSGTWDKVNNNVYTGFTPNSKPLVADVFWYALNMDTGVFQIYKNNVLQATSFTWLTWTLYPMSCVWSNWKTCIANFWATTMTYAAPSWYNQWFYS